MKEVDKGFELFYKNLSNRRKFIRTVWLSIIGIFILLYVLLTVENKGRTLIFVVIFVAVGIRQLFITYRGYREEKDCQNNSSLRGTRT